MTKFKHGCFISYRNGNKDDKLDLLNSFAEQICDALETELRTQLDNKPVFLDKRSLQGGYILNPTIAGSICRSVCMVVIFTRNYLSEDKLFCASELYAMLECEKARHETIGIANPDKSFIITIVLRNPDHVPKILEKRLFYDFSPFTLAEEQIRLNPNYAATIAKIASYIADCFEEMEGHERKICQGCEQFSMPDVDEVDGKKIILDFIGKHKKKFDAQLIQS